MDCKAVDCSSSHIPKGLTAVAASNLPENQ